MKTLLSLLVVPTLALSMDSPPSVMKGFEGRGAIIIPRSRISAPSKMGQMAAIVNRNGFSIIQEGQETEVKHHDVGPILRKANKDQLLHLLKNNKLRVTQYDNNDYKLELANDLKGGGPLLGAALYCGTYIVAYGGAIIGVGAAANAITRDHPSTGVGVATGAAAGYAGSAAGGPVFGAATGAAVGGLGQNPQANDAVAGAAVAVACGGTWASFAAAVEAAAEAAAAFGTALPTP